LRRIRTTWSSRQNCSRWLRLSGSHEMSHDQLSSNKTLFIMRTEAIYYHNNCFRSQKLLPECKDSTSVLLSIFFRPKFTTSNAHVFSTQFGNDIRFLDLFFQLSSEDGLMFYLLALPSAARVGRNFWGQGDRLEVCWLGRAATRKSPFGAFLHCLFLFDD